MLKKILITIGCIILILTALGGSAIYWLKSFIPSAAETAQIKASQMSDVVYLQQPIL